MSNERPTYKELERKVQELEAKLAKQLPKNNETNNKSILNSLPATIALVNENGKILSVNDKWIEFAHNNSPNIDLVPYTDFNYFEVCKKDDTDKNALEALKGIKDVLNEKSDKFDHVYPCHSPNEERWFLMRAVKLKSNKRQIVVSHLDITEQKKAEHALKESEEKLRLLGDNIPKGQVYQFIVRQNGNRSFTYVSKKVEELHEHTAEQVVADSSLLLDRVLRDDMTGLETEAEKSIREMCELDHEFRIKKKSGEIRWHRMVAKPRKLNNGDILFDGIDLDITTQKENELQLKNYSQKLEKLNKDKDKFMSILAHDLKTPFSSLLGFSNLLVDNFQDYDTEEIKNLVTKLNDLSKLSYRMLDDILFWSRAQSGNMPNNPEKIYFTEICNPLIKENESQALAKNITVKCDVPTNLNVFADIHLVKTILRNLVTNAIKFTQSGGEVVIAAWNEKNETFVSVTDTGVGIRKDTLSKLFNITSNTSTRGTSNEKGTGLGLQICKEFTKKMGGKIWAESSEGKGSTFYFTIPVQKKTAKPKQKAEEKESAPSKQIKPVHQLKTLIAEDDEDSVAYLRTVVGSHNTELLYAFTGKEAIELAKKHKDLDLILMDIKLPVIDGLEATRKIREFNKEIKIIAQTAYALEGDREKALEAGCDDYISKPIDKAILMKKLEEVIE